MRNNILKCTRAIHVPQHNQRFRNILYKNIVIHNRDSYFAILFLQFNEEIIFICRECWQKTVAFHDFYEYVQTRHESLKAVVECKFEDLNTGFHVPKEADIFFESIKIEDLDPEITNSDAAEGDHHDDFSFEHNDDSNSTDSDGKVRDYNSHFIFCF